MESTKKPSLRGAQRLPVLNGVPGEQSPITPRKVTAEKWSPVSSWGLRQPELLGCAPPTNDTVAASGAVCGGARQPPTLS